MVVTSLNYFGNLKWKLLQFQWWRYPLVGGLGFDSQGSNAVVV